MKRLIAFSLTLILLLAGCGAPAAKGPAGPAFTITDGAYDCTPDELVTELLAVREKMRVDFEVVEIPMPSDVGPNFEGTYLLTLMGRWMSLSIHTADDGRVSSIRLSWQGSSLDTGNAAIIVYSLLYMFMPTDIEQTLEAVDEEVNSQGDLTIVSDGTKLDYFYHGDLGHSFSLKPAE